MLEKLRTAKSIFLISILIFGVCSLALISYYQTKATNTAVDSINNSQKVLYHCQKLRSELERQATSSRDFKLTRDKKFLAVTSGAQERMNLSLVELKKDIGQNNNHQYYVDSLEKTLAALRASMKRESASSYIENEAGSTKVAEHSSEYLEEISRELIRKIDIEAHIIIYESASAQRVSFINHLFWSKMLIGLFASLCILLFVRFQRQIKRRDAEQEAFSKSLNDSNNEVERKKTELSQSNLMLTQMIESISDDTFILDREWRIVKVAKKIAERTSLNPNDLKDRILWDLYPDLVDSEFHQRAKLCMHNGKYDSFLHYYEASDIFYLTHFLPSENHLTVCLKNVTLEEKMKEEYEYGKYFVQSVLGASPDLICIHDLIEHQNVYMNDGLQLNLEYSDEEVSKMENQIFKRLMHPDDYQHYAVNIKPKYDSLKKNEVIEYQYRLKDAHGIWRWFNCRENVFSRTKEGRAKRILGIASDMNNQKLAEEQLKAKEAQKEELLDNMVEVVQLVDFDFNYLYVNKAAEAKFGMMLSDAIGTNAKDNGVIRDSGFFNKMKAAMADRIATKSEGEMRNFDGHLRWYHHSIQPISEGLMIISKDITHRKQMEDELSNRSNYLTTIVQTEPDGVFLTSIKGEIIEINAAGLTLLQAQAEEEVIGKNLLNFVDEADRNELTKHLSNAGHGKPGRHEFELIGLEKGRNWIDVHSVVLPNEGHLSKGVLSIMRDVSQHKNYMDNVLEMNAQLNEMSIHLEQVREQERRLIAREIHNELGQQLSAMKFEVAWMQANKHENQDERLKSVIDSLNGSIETIRQIASDLHPPILEDFGLTAALNWYIYQWEDRTGIKCNFETNLKDFVFDKQLATVVFRICQESFTNIIKHANASEVDVVFRSEGNIARLKITDNGTGFNIETDLRKSSMGWRGMKERAKMIAGEVEVITAKEKGTTVLLTFQTSDIKT